MVFLLAARGRHPQPLVPRRAAVAVVVVVTIMGKLVVLRLLLALQVPALMVPHIRIQGLAKQVMV